jgi:UPF0755 protein
VTSARVAAILTANPVLEGRSTRLPKGTVLPETYDVHRGEIAPVVLKRMTDAQDRLRARSGPSASRACRWTAGTRR